MTLKEKKIQEILEKSKLNDSELLEHPLSGSIRKASDWADLYALTDVESDFFALVVIEHKCSVKHYSENIVDRQTKKTLTTTHVVNDEKIVVTTRRRNNFAWEFNTTIDSTKHGKKKFFGSDKNFDIRAAQDRAYLKWIKDLDI